MADKPSRGLKNPALFVCDIQEKFRPAIFEYEKVILTTQKLLKAAEMLDIPVYATTQNASRLGPTCSELHLPKAVEHVDKTKFSMWIPSIARHFSRDKPAQVLIVGIESHICVTQTALDLLREEHDVYVCVDGVSSCNREEVPVALARLAREGVRCVSSEGWLYEVMGDAAISEFKSIARLVKETSKNTKEVMATLLSKM